MTLLKKTPDYHEEFERLNETIQYMTTYLENIQNMQEVYRNEVKEAFINLDYLDSSQSYITILVNARRLDNSRESIEKVSRAKAKPYFARIDFTDDRKRLPASYYIGKISLFTENQEPVIIDWRSPVAGIYL